jgi:hypothetical protein
MHLIQGDYTELVSITSSYLPDLTLNIIVIRLYMNSINPQFEKQLESVVTEHVKALTISSQEDASDILNNTDVFDMRTRCLAAIERITGRNSVYFEEATKLSESKANAWDQLSGQIGVARSLLNDMRNGYLKSLEELIHADVFTDYLEMSDHLNDSGYKDAAAVLAGSTLEAHLKQLCLKHSIPVDNAGTPKKANVINTELAKVSAYSKTDVKNVTAWLGLRNDAAHGDYGKYDSQQVKLLTASIRDFITRTPA